MTADLAAGGPREAHRPEEDNRLKLDLVRLGHGLADSGEDLLRVSARAQAIDLQDHDQPLLPIDLDGERRGRVGAQGGMALRGAPFDVLGIKVTAPDDDHVLEPARDEKLSVAKETQIARAEERASLIAIDPGAEGLGRGLGSVPVASGHARVSDPDFADAIGEALRGSRRNDDRNLPLGVGGSASDELRESRPLLDSTAFQGRRHRPWRRVGPPAVPPARDQEGPLGQAVAGEEGFAAESARGERLRESIERLRVGSVRRPLKATRHEERSSPDF